MESDFVKYPIPEQKGYYADKRGNIYSRWINKGKNGLVIGDDFKRLRCSVSKSGYIGVTFRRNEKRILVHRLIYQMFKGEIPEGVVVRHLNDNPSDNRIENLEIGTQSDNMKDCVRNGHHKTNRKIKTEDQVKIIELKKNHTWKEVALIFGVNEKTVRNHAAEFKERRRVKFEYFKSYRTPNKRG